MSTQRSRRYPGLHYFTTEQKAQFFGREAEKSALLALVLTEKIVTLFGKSGYGKSSLLRAGLIPELPAGWLPIVIQLGAYQAGQSLSPLERTLTQLDAALPTNTPETAFLERISDPASLWYRFRRKESGEKRSFLLLFDQFEEFQTYPPEQQAAFKQQLAELLFTRIPQAVRDASDELPDDQQDLLARPTEVKAVFAIREDRLSVLDSLADKLPAILHKRYHLKGLDDRQATQAIVSPAALPQAEHFESPTFQYEPAAIQAIKRGLKKDDQEATIESFLLQICCEEIERGVIERSRKTKAAAEQIVVTERDLPVFKDLFEQYYRHKIAALPGEALQTAARRMIEDQLIKTDAASGIDYRVNADGRVLCALPGVDESLLKRLTDAFLLRSEPNTTGGFSYEVSHDRLVEGILVMKKEYETAEAEKRSRQERIEAEKRAQEAEEKAAEERRRAEAAERLKEEAEQQRSIAQENETRARQRTRVAALLALLALAGLAFSWVQYRETNKEREKAVQAQQDAETQKNQALIARRSADSLLVIAVRNDSLARREAKNARTALQRQVEAERATKRQQLQTFEAQAADFRNKKQYDNAIAAYRSALPLAEDEKNRQVIRQNIARCEAEKQENDFKINKERGLRLVEVNECKAALPYLQAALKIRKDQAVEDALKKCQ